MTVTHGPEVTAAILDLCAIPAVDRRACTLMLDTPADPGTQRALETLDARWGDAEAPVLKQLDGVTEEQWIEAILRFAPVAAERLERSGVSPSVIEATFADIGKQMELHRRTHGGFGMDAWSWVLLHLSGMLFRLGRLQYHLHRETPKGPWTVGVHIPEDGPLDPASVDESLALATEFFARRFPAARIDHANCDSWLLDPYLAAGLPASNMARFAARFSNVELRDQPYDALYFTFRVPKGTDPATLPRDSSLQRLVLERIDAGGTWQIGKGLCAWPESRA
ncbi:acyltransferase domain-containing protein [Paeniglutamicibacter sp. NPDC091659]|uniref:acyltransferase domain-containing protein n=1 Tax=Paeniglutamicibacter sp. NPDC091659 TaxID=3364389 RepID=UPI00382BA2F9